MNEKVGKRQATNHFASTGIVHVLVILSLCAFIFCGMDSVEKIPNGGEAKSVKEIIMAKEKDAMERWRNGDPWGWAEISAPEVTYIDPDLTKHIEGLEEYKKLLKQVEGMVEYQGSDFINPRFVIHDNMAVLTYNYKSTQTRADGSVIDQTLWNTTEVYCLLDNNWKIIHTHWSYVKQKLPQRTEVPIHVELSRKTWEGVAGELMAMESAAMERYRKGDPGGFTEISAPEVTYFDTGTPGRLDGLDALRTEYAKREGKIRYDVMEFIDPKVQVHGDAAVLSYRFFSTKLNSDGSIASRTPWNCTEVFFKIDGKWKIIHTHWSFINGRKE
jgi:ketosteroid isomerase-like protein